MGHLLGFSEWNIGNNASVQTRRREEGKLYHQILCRFIARMLWIYLILLTINPTSTEEKHFCSTTWDPRFWLDTLTSSLFALHPWSSHVVLSTPALHNGLSSSYVDASTSQDTILAIVNLNMVIRTPQRRPLMDEARQLDDVVLSWPQTQGRRGLNFIVTLSFWTSLSIVV